MASLKNTNAPKDCVLLHIRDGDGCGWLVGAGQRNTLERLMPFAERKVKAKLLPLVYFPVYVLCR